VSSRLSSFSIPCLLLLRMREPRVRSRLIVLVVEVGVNPYAFVGTVRIIRLLRACSDPIGVAARSSGASTLPSVRVIIYDCATL